VRAPRAEAAGTAADALQDQQLDKEEEALMDIGLSLANQLFLAILLTAITFVVLAWVVIELIRRLWIAWKGRGLHQDH